MELLREEDWNDAENNIYPKKLLFDEPWLRYLTQYPKIWLDMPSTWERRRKKITKIFLKILIMKATLDITCEIFIIKPMDIFLIFLQVFMIYK